MYLNCHSYYSLRYGTMSIDTLLDKAQENGIKALALTDINNTTGVVDFVKECKERNIKPIVGVEFRNDNNLLYICLAKNREGFREIAEFLSRCNFEKSLFPDEAPIFNNVYVIYPYGIVINRKLRDNEFIGIYPSSLRKLDVINHNSSKQKRVALFPVSFENFSTSEVIGDSNQKAVVLIPYPQQEPF